jgi:protein Jumonji
MLQPSVDQIERKFWKIVEHGQPTTIVQTAHVDTQLCGSAFPSSWETPYAKHEWNFNILQHNPQSLLTHIGPIVGLNVPTLHISMLFSTSCWSSDQHFLPQIYYLHSGADIIWYCVNGNDEDKLKQVMGKHLSCTADSSPLWLSQNSIMISPDKLVQSGIGVSRVVQKAGEFVVVFPQSIVAQVCCGYSISESLRFAPVDWFPLGCRAAQILAENCQPDKFSIDQLIVAVARGCLDSTVTSHILRMAATYVTSVLEDELCRRNEVVRLGAKHAGMLPDVAAECRPGRQQNRRLSATPAAMTTGGEFSNECRRCYRCHKLCYLSMVLCERDGHVYCLRHAVDCLRSVHSQPTDYKLFARCDEKELNSIVAATSSSSCSRRLSQRNHLRGLALPAE